MRNVVIRAFALVLQFILYATVINLFSMAIERLFEVYPRRYRRPMIEFSPVLNSLPPQPID
jgi:hypothetical protein